MPTVNVHIVLTYTCNQQCIFCYNQGTIAKDHATQSLKIEEFKEILKWVKDNIPNATFSFTGGEPTLHKRIIDFIKAVKNEYHIGIISNGTFNYDFIKKIMDYDVSIQFSLEGHTRNLHNLIVGRESFDRIVSNIKFALKLLGDNRVSTNTTINNRNIKYAGKIFRFIKELGLKRASFNYASPNGYNHEIVPDLCKYAEILKNIELLSSVLGISLRNLGVLPKCIYQESPSCSAGTTLLVIDPLLDIYACPSIAFEDTKIGNIRTSDFDDVLSSKIYKMIHVDHSHLPEDCLSCKFLKECKGGCYLFWRHNIDPRRCKNGRTWN